MAYGSSGGANPSPKKGASTGGGKGDGSAFGTAGAGNTKGRMPTPPGRITTTAAQRAASNRKD